VPIKSMKISKSITVNEPKLLKGMLFELFILLVCVRGEVKIMKIATVLAAAVTVAAAVAAVAAATMVIVTMAVTIIRVMTLIMIIAVKVLSRTALM
jgi:hypothetical protein